MIQRILLRILLAPFSLLYGLGVFIRNWFYDQGVLKSFEFNLPVISVGNMSMGGEGKTPHIEYLILLLKDYLQVGVLSRGYNRKTKGFRFVNVSSNARECGDEPLQFKRKFPQTVVAVSESRSIGIPQMLKAHPDLQVILLDDAFQHRSVKPGLNILVTSYQRPFFEDFLLPAGRLREWRSSRHRADMIIVSKCPPQLNEGQVNEFVKRLKTEPHQQVFFTTYEYGRPYSFFRPGDIVSLKDELDIVLITGIADNQYLLDFLSPRVGDIRHLEFEDHHFFSSYDVARMADIYKTLSSSNKIILTTEKDATRLEIHYPYLNRERLPIYVLPLRVKFLGRQDGFADTVKTFLLDFRV